MENKELFVKSFLSGRTSSFIHVDRNKIDLLFAEIVDKIVNGETLDSTDNRFLEIYLKEYYPLKCEFGITYNYDYVLNESNKKLVKYFISNTEKITHDNIMFIFYYFCLSMCREYNFHPLIYFNDIDFFKENPNANAYHTKDAYNNMPIINFNPRYIDKEIKNDGILNIINTCFHELEHEVQSVQVEQTTITNAQSLLWAKEYLLRKVIGEVYYKENYRDQFLERDARDYAKRRIEKVEEEYGDPTKKYNIAGYKKEDAHYTTDIKHRDVENKRDVVAIDLLDAVSCEYLKAYPYLLKKMKDIKVLNVIFNSDGSKKNIVQIKHELDEQKQKEIQKNPEDEKRIHANYSSLLHNIAKTDNDLLIQYLCMEADELAKENDDLGVRTKVARINMIMLKRNISFEELFNRINERIHQLEKKSYKDPDYLKVRDELKETKVLVDCLLKYNEKFKQQHDQKLINDKYRKDIERIAGVTINDKNWLVGDSSGDGSVIFEDKTIEELTSDFLYIKRQLNNSDVDLEAYEELIKFLQKQYQEYIDNRTTINVPDRKYEGPSPGSR